MGFGSRASLAAILGFAAAFVVACGSSGDGLLSPSQSHAIAGRLNAISSAVRAHDCGRSAAASRRLEHDISRLPAAVDQRLVRNLGQGAVTVSQLAAQDCQTQTTTPTTTTPTQTTTTQTTQTTPTITQTHTETVTQPTTTPTTTAQQPTQPPATNPGQTGTSGNTGTGGGAPVTGGTTPSGG